MGGSSIHIDILMAFFPLRLHAETLAKKSLLW